MQNQVDPRTISHVRITRRWPGHGVEQSFHPTGTFPKSTLRPPVGTQLFGIHLLPIPSHVDASRCWSCCHELTTRISSRSPAGHPLHFATLVDALRPGADPEPTRPLKDTRNNIKKTATHFERIDSLRCLWRTCQIAGGQAPLRLSPSFELWPLAKGHLHINSKLGPWKASSSGYRICSRTFLPLAGCRRKSWKTFILATHQFVLLGCGSDHSSWSPQMSASKGVGWFHRCRSKGWNNLCTVLGGSEVAKNKPRSLVWWHFLKQKGPFNATVQVTH